ncbi:MAG: redoxin domain-containing protein [Phycisphaerales bacterium]|jgi:peroxiredoxin|nr:redoxin domain-containing protein [Phycisphaerales bacterium]MDP6891137.1 redoxin domain-containing protein [Phycisphaerales bacterium]
MNITTRATWSAVIFTAVVSGVVATPVPPPTPTPIPAPSAKAKVGQKAPAFSLSDTDGKQHALKDYAGKIIVLEWFNADCPFSGKDGRRSVHATGRATAVRKQLKIVDPGIVYLLVDSTAHRKTKPDIIATDKAARTQWKIDAPILIDFDGKVGRAYSAKTTPHMFIIDEAGVLRYEGAFDDNQRNADRDDTTNYVLAAVKKLKAGEPPSPSHVKSWGCSVKYGL